MKLSVYGLPRLPRFVFTTCNCAIVVDLLLNIIQASWPADHPG